MTEVQANTPEPVAAAGAEGPYSKDYWDNVFEQIGRRPMVKVALAVLALLYASAIYAPLIANDRPYVLEDAVDFKAYGRSLRTTYAVTASVKRLAGMDEEAFAATLSDEDTIRTRSAALEQERVALTTSLSVLRLYLPDAEEGPLGTIEAEANAAVDAALAGETETAVASAEVARKLARAARKSLKAADPKKPEAEGMTLEPQTTYPLLASITSIEVFFMWLWALVLTWPLWNRIVNRFLLGGDRERIRRARRPKLMYVAGSSVVALLAWMALVGGSVTFETAPYKSGLTSEDITAARVVFPPIAMGMAESHLGERFRGPTWHGESEMDADGHYVSGSRKPAADPVTGLLPPSQSVEIRSGEPDLNDSGRYLLGTDSMGRDLLTRILYGGRISLSIGILSTFFLILIGIFFGAISGYFGGWVDMLIMRVIEVVQSFPAFFLILVAVSLIPDDKLHPVFAITALIAIVRWTGVARLVRGEFLRLKEQEFVLAARALGFGNMRVIFRHVLPNAMGPVLVAAAFSVAAGILTESGISFLGLGVKLPIPSWGSLLNEARGMAEFWWLQVFSGVLIFVTVFCYNVVGEGVRDALDPRRKV